MLLGEKIRNARVEAGLTQEEFAEMIMVSRAAVAKWEGGRGLPDVANLKVIADALGVTVDYLLDKDNPIDLSIIKKPIDLAKYGLNAKLGVRKKIKIKEQIIRDEYADDEIIMLTVTKFIPNSSEKFMDNFIGCITTLFGGIPLFDTFAFGKAVESIGSEQYYLVNKKEKQFFVLITDEYIISRMMRVKFTDKKMCVGDKEFTQVGKLREVKS